MKVPLVDRDDVQIGTKERSELTGGDIHRVSALWLTNSKGEVLLAQRALVKSDAPGKWGPAVAGTVEDEETYESNIVKETQEEIGLVVSPEQLMKGPKTLTEHPTKRSNFTQWFLLRIDAPVEQFIIQENEVAQVRWVNEKELKEWFTKTPDDFVSSAVRWLPLLAHTE